MRTHIGESDRRHGKALYQAIVELLRQEKFAGATVLRGVAGFGGHYHYHIQKILRLAQELLVIVEVVDYAERIEKILPRLNKMVGGSLITLEKAHVILCLANEDKQPFQIDDQTLCEL